MTTTRGAMTTRLSANGRPRRGLGFLVPLALIVATLGACGDRSGRAGDQEGSAGRADTVTVDPGGPAGNSSAAQPVRRPPGDTVSITATLTEFAVAVTPDTIDSGDISLLLQNDGERPHTIEIRGDNGMRWVSLPIRPGSALTMSMRIDPGQYTVASTDSVYIERGMRSWFQAR